MSTATADAGQGPNAYGGVSVRHEKAGMTIGIMAFMGLLVTYVETMITPALPILVNFFSTNYDQLSWVITAYVISGTISAAIFGRLADIYGKKKIFLVLATGYTIAVSFGGFAQTLPELIAIRAVQGLGMGMFPVAFALLNDQLPKRELALAQGIVSATFAGGAAIGLVIGAWITQNYGWQWSYHSAIPVSIGLVVVSYIVLHDESLRKEQSIDLPSIVLLGAGLVALILSLSEGQTWGWFSFQTVLTFSLSAVFLASFVFSEKRSSEPFINMELLKVRNVFLANFTGLFGMAALYFLFYSIPPLLQDPQPAGFGESILQSGIVLLPASLLSMAFAPVGAKVTTEKGPKVTIIIGSAILFLAYLGLYFNRANELSIAEDAAILGLGMSFIFVGVINILLLSTPPEKSGEATGMNVVFRNIGTSLAPALGGVFETAYVMKAMVGFVPVQYGSLPFIPVFVSFPSTHAFDLIYITGMLFLVASIIFTLLMKNIVVKKVET